MYCFNVVVLFHSFLVQTDTLKGLLSVNTKMTMPDFGKYRRFADSPSVSRFLLINKKYASSFCGETANEKFKETIDI